MTNQINEQYLESFLRDVEHAMRKQDFATLELMAEELRNFGANQEELAS